MNTAELIWMNGEFIAWEDAKVHVLTHSLHYGTGVFEGIRAYDTEVGTAIFRHHDHLARLENSAKLYYMDIPYSREQLREWRLSTPDQHFREFRKRFEDAGISLFAYTVNFRNDYTDEELDKAFEQAQALGVNIIAASTQLSVAKRLVPFAEKHRIYVAVHGHSNIQDPDEFATPESLSKALALSKYFKINLDIGHFTAANFDAVQFIRENHAHITHLHMKDRKKNQGPNVPWGEGDTPIKAVLALLKE